MIRISAQLELNGVVIHDTASALGEGLWFGDHADAVVVFEGASLHVAPFSCDAAGSTVSVAGGSSPVLLRPGGTLRIELEGGAALTLGVVQERRLARENLFAGDIRLLVLTAALVLFGVWVETLDRWTDRNPEVAAEVAALPFIAMGLKAEPEAALPPVTPPKVHAPVEFD